MNAQSCRWLLLALASGTFVGCELGTRTFETSRSLTAPHHQGMSLRVETENGPVTVRRTKRADVGIEAKLRTATPERAETVKVLADSRPDGSLFVHVVWPDKRQSHEGCGLEISLPGAHGIDARTSNGGIEVEGLSGQARLNSSHSAVRVRDHEGSVDAESSNGRLELIGVRGSIAARTSNGAIEASDVAGSIDAETSNGSVDLSLNSPGPVVASSSNGSITLNVTEAFTGELHASTSNGHVEVAPALQPRVVSSKDTECLLRFSAGGKSRLETSNGSIHIR